MKKGYLFIFLFFTGYFALGQVPTASKGSIRRFENFTSKYVVPRNIDVWLPEGYDPSKKYAVLYMHDGRSLFDSTIVWNRQEWGVDEVMTKLLFENKIMDCIVVGAWNSEYTRHNEYLPQKPFESMSAADKDTVLRSKRAGGSPVFKEYDIRSDNYLRFLVKELKPFIDSSFATYKDRKHTFIAGSSMGGLISLYAICEYPHVFGGAACLSTHWTGIFRAEQNPFPAAMMKYLSTHAPSPKKHRIYFDHGTVSLDILYGPFQLQADGIMYAKGYTEKNFMTKIFPGADHSERSWNSRLELPLVFLLKK